MTTTSPTIEISIETYDILQQIKKIFVSYTGEDIDSFSDDKIIEILASGFLGSEDDNKGGCGDNCACNHNQDEEHKQKDNNQCKGNCKH